MKKFFLLFVFALTFLSACTSDDTTTYYLIRHAEKDRTDKTNRNPSLNSQGEKRAQDWANYFDDIDIDAVYSTNYYRTIETATPTAMTKKLQLKKYEVRNMYDSVFKAETKGKSVLIVGHSNTTPIFANKILGDIIYPNMDDNDNSSLYIISINKEGKKESRIEKIN